MKISFSVSDNKQKLFLILKDVFQNKQSSSDSDILSQNELKSCIQTFFEETDIKNHVSEKDLNKVSQENFQEWVSAYRKEINVDFQKGAKQLQFHQDEVFQFLEWLIEERNLFIESDNNEQEKVNGSNVIGNDNENMQQSHLSKLSSENAQQLASNDQKTSEDKQSEQPQSLRKLNQQKSDNQQEQSNSKQHVDRDMAIEHANNLLREIPNHPNDHDESEKPSTELHQENTRPETLDLQQLESKYKQYLEIIFQHYCKLTYTTEQSPTFDSIQHKASIMTMNKFMIFNKDFEIGSIVAPTGKDGKNKSINTNSNVRTILMEIFKKNAECYKEMSFEQFVATIEKISLMAFAKLKLLEEAEDVEALKTEKLSYELIKMLQYMEISYPKEFKEKMRRLNINHLIKTNKQVSEKKIPLNYKFKFGEGGNQPERHLINEERSKLVSDHKQKNDGRQNFLAAKPPLQSNKINPTQQFDVENKNRRKAASRLQNGDQGRQARLSHSVDRTRKNRISAASSSKDLGYGGRKRNIIEMQPSNTVITPGSKKNLGPLIPPVRKTSNFKSMNSSSPNIPPGLVGYSKIHMAKKGVLDDGCSKGESPMTNSRKKLNDFQLNNIVEEARNIVHYDENDTRAGRAYSNHTNLYSQEGSSGFPSPNRSMSITGLPTQSPHMLKSDNTSGFLAKPPLLSLNDSSSQFKPLQDLDGLVDFSDTDEDEYLVQHLKKEQNSTDFAKRIDKKIEML